MLILHLTLALAAGTPHLGAPLEDDTPSAIEWYQGPHMSALGKARGQDSPLLVYFWMNGSRQCERMFGETLQDAQVGGELEGVICQGIDIATRQGAKLVQQYGIVTLPTLLYITSEGEREDAILGFIAAPALVGELQRIKAGTGTVSDFKRQVKAAPDDLALLYRYATKLRDIGDLAGHDARVAEIRQRDPEGLTLTGSRLAFWEVRTQALSQGVPKDVDVGPVVAHVEEIKLQQVRFEAWIWLAGFEYEREARADARKAYVRAHENVAEDDALNFGIQTARVFWLMRDELDRKEKKFMLDIARASAERARKLDSAQGNFGNDEFEVESYDQYLAMALDSQAMAEYVNGNSRRAIGLVEECIQLWPDGEEYPGRLEQMKDGRP